MKKSFSSEALENGKRVMKIRKTYLRLVSVLFFSNTLAMACAPAEPMLFSRMLKMSQ